MIPLTEAASYTDVLWVCKYCSTKFMIEDVFPRFRRALFDRIKDMTDQELRVSPRLPVVDVIQLMIVTHIV